MKVAICIPVFDNPETVAKVVDDCIKLTDLPIIIVDDGSRIPVSTLLQSSEILVSKQANRIQIIRLQENMGKGMALRTAFHWGSQNDFSHLLTIDADGQHYVESINAMIETTRLKADALVIGVRKMEPSKTPLISRVGRALSNIWVFLVTGKNAFDSQSGLRIYPIYLMKEMMFWTKRYDFELEVLLKAIWNGISVSPVPIEVFYPDPKIRISHFHKIKDNLRIFKMNLYIVFYFIRISFAHGAKKTVPRGFGGIISRLLAKIAL